MVQFKNKILAGAFFPFFFFLNFPSPLLLLAFPASFYSMSNPIADTADYFARWKQYGVPYAQDPQDDESHPTQDSNREDISTDPRSQWQRVLNRISFLNPPTQPEVTEDISDDDDSVIVDRDTFELMRSRQHRPTSRHHSVQVPTPAVTTSRHHSLNVSSSANGAIRGRDDTTEEQQEHIVEEEEEEKLPSAYDLENDQIYPLSDHQEDEESNYFTHPFNNAASDRPFVAAVADSPLPTITPRKHQLQQGEEEEEDEPSSSSFRGKDKWDRTIDKLKLIANLQSSNNNNNAAAPPTLPNMITGPSHTLATYYPPAFDPIFAAFAKDEYDRNLVMHFSII